MITNNLNEKERLKFLDCVKPIPYRKRHSKHSEGIHLLKEYRWGYPKKVKTEMQKFLYLKDLYYVYKVIDKGIFIDLLSVIKLRDREMVEIQDIILSLLIDEV